MTRSVVAGDRSHRNHLAGVAAEGCIARNYQRRGFTVARERWRSASGEIDLIMQNGDALVFVEVKKSRTHAAAAARVSQRQMARLYDAGARYLSETGASMDTEIRFDVALVDSQGQVEILENAFGGC
ncbi:MAG: YraN family protein [Paracoccaceae bacterium]